MTRQENALMRIRHELELARFAHAQGFGTPSTIQALEQRERELVAIVAKERAEEIALLSAHRWTAPPMAPDLPKPEQGWELTPMQIDETQPECERRINRARD